MLTERLMPCINSSTDGRLSFDEFETWFLDTRAGLLRLMDVATAEAAAPDPCAASKGQQPSSSEEQAAQTPTSRGRSRSFVCRQDPNWPSDEYLSAAVSHLGKRLVSLADFPEVRVPLSLPRCEMHENAAVLRSSCSSSERRFFFVGNWHNTFRLGSISSVPLASSLVAQEASSRQACLRRKAGMQLQ